MIQDNTAKWHLKKLTDFGVAKSALPVGHLYFSLEKTVPVGSIPAFGGLYNRALYADLFAYAQERDLVITEERWQSIASANNGKCEYYSSGDGSTTFRVPKIPNTIVGEVPSEVPVVGNGMTLGLTDGSRDAGLRYYYANGTPMYLIANTASLGKDIGDPAYIASNAALMDVGIGITTDTTKSGIVAKTSATKITGQWLIVAFGTTSNVGNADVANVMQAVERVQTGVGALQDGVGTAVDYIVESWRNGTEWYEVYKSGKVRQGGWQGKYSYIQTVTLHLPMADNKYYANASGSDVDARNVLIGSKTTTSFLKMSINSAGAGSDVEITWYVEGQGA